MSSRHNFHDGQIESFALGPRRELTIKIALDPVWNVQGPRSVAMRFGTIENFEEVAAFFEALPTPPAPDAYIAEIEGIVFSEKEANGVVVDLASHGSIRIRARHFSEG